LSHSARRGGASMDVVPINAEETLFVSGEELIDA
jgi:hypothetical protein